MPLNLAPNKFHERPSGAFGIQENLLTAALDPPGGAYSALPESRPLSNGGEGLAAPSLRTLPRC